jgi:hypothetical protein
MIIRVKLHSAITGQIAEIARAKIANIGGSETLGNYATETLHGPCAARLNKGIVQRSFFIEKYPRKARYGDPAVLGPRSSALDGERKRISDELQGTSGSECGRAPSGNSQTI